MPKSSERSKIKITIPELPVDDVSTDKHTPGDEVSSTKAQKKLNGGGLLGLLPSPKSKVTNTIESSGPKPNLHKKSEPTSEHNPMLEKISSFLPLKSEDHDAKQKNLDMTSAAKSATKSISLVAAYDSDASSESSREDKISSDFFGLNSKFTPQVAENDVETVPEESPPQNITHANETDAALDYLIHCTDDNAPILGSSSVPVQNILDDEALKRLTGDRKRRQPIHCIDVDANQLRNQDIDALKQLTQERETAYTGVSLGGEGKRRHQITYLALQARQMETQLKNKWAKSRANRQQSRMKYGF